MKTRKEYLDGEVTHRDYYAQFVNAQTIAYVVQRIGGEAIDQSTDPHMNDIPLRMWDMLAPFLVVRFRDAGDLDSLSGRVCVAKEAARQYKERQR